MQRLGSPGSRPQEMSEYMGMRDNSRYYQTAVIGAGASGCMAAVSAAMRGDGVVLMESNDRIGRKIYATGNGRCNLTNLHRDDNCYHVGGGGDLSPFFARFDERDLIRFWETRGVYLHDRQGYVYPRTDQAATIAEGFGKILSALPVTVRTACPVREIEKRGDRFVILTSSGERLQADRVILACGGMAGPQYGCRGDGYRFAERFGHTVRRPLPALVPLLESGAALLLTENRSSENRSAGGRSGGNRSAEKRPAGKRKAGKGILSAAAGVRCDARITLITPGSAGKADSVRARNNRDASAAGSDVVLGSERGELQITDKGISGIPVFQISGSAAAALDEGRSVIARIDFLPDLTPECWAAEKERRLSEDRNCMLGSFFLGLVNKKVLDLILQGYGLQAEKKAAGLTEEQLTQIMESMRAYEISVGGTGTFEQAQVTRGGVPLEETDENLQSLLESGLYLAGELLDVDGICGGYNLQWAMTSGWIAGGMELY